MPSAIFDRETPPELRHQILTYLAGEFLSDRERARLLGLPDGCRIRERAKILCPENLTLGKNVWIGEGAVLDAQGGLSIGDNTQIGLNVLVWSHTSHRQCLEGKTGSRTKEGIQYKPTVIGANCFIAGPAVIAPGVTIGDGVTVTPLTFVDHDLPNGAICSTHREIKRLSRRLEQIERQLRTQTPPAGAGDIETC